MLRCLCVFTLVSGVAWAQEGPTPAPESTHIVQTGPFTLSMDREGRLEAAHKAPLRYVPAAYGGALIVREVVTRGGAVKAGEPVIRLEGISIEEDLRSASENLDDLRQRLDWTRTEHQLQRESSAIRLEQSEKAKADADRALAVFKQFDGPRMLKAAELSLQGNQHNVDDQKEELAQLESMYKGTTLATDTKDIVLERARRSLRMAQEWFGIAQNDRKVTVDFHFPARERDVLNAARWADTELDHTRASIAIADGRKQQEVAIAERAVRDAETRLKRLESDAAALVMSAPLDGVLAAITLEPGDQVGARQTLGEVSAPELLQVRLNVPPEDLRILSNESKVTVALAGLPEASSEAAVLEIGSVAGADGLIPVTLRLSGRHDLHRVGLKCRVTAHRTLDAVVTVPKAAIVSEHGRTTCRVRSGDKVEARVVVVGATEGDVSQVVRGLAAGDEIVMQATP